MDGHHGCSRVRVALAWLASLLAARKFAGGISCPVTYATTAKAARLSLDLLQLVSSLLQGQVALHKLALSFAFPFSFLALTLAIGSESC